MDKFASDVALPPLPLGDSVFSKLRKNGKIYVDKTRMIYELAKSDNQVFLARPRRFGKSLLISTFYSLFKFGLRDFAGLDIESLWKDQGKYTVVSFDFSLIKNFIDLADFRRQLDRYLMEYLHVNGMLEKAPTVSDDGISEFKKWLAMQSESSVVLLIDEYDGPMTSCLSDSETFEDVRRVMASFYSCLKGCSEAFRFVFLTGITKFGNAGIFSELNALRDISLLPAFGTILGYTHEELKHYFTGYIKRSSKLIGLSEDPLITQLTTNYNGFCFELTAKQKVFSPWSILNFFTNPEIGFINYWFESGGQPSILMQYIRDHALINPSTYSKERSIYRTKLSTSASSNEIDEDVLLYQTGYLTIKRYGSDGTIYLGYPNLEVMNSMAELSLSRLLRDRTLAQVNAGDIPRFLTEGNENEFIKRLNNAFLALDYKHYFIKDEYTCQGAFLLILHGSGLQAQVVTHNAHSRSDLEFTIGNLHWIIELKFAKESRQIDRKLKEGIYQITTRHSGEQNSGKKIVRLVMVFSEKDRRFIDYKVIED